MKLRLKEILSEKAMTSVALANKVGISRVAMSNIVTGKALPSVERLEAMANALDVPIWQMFVSADELKGSEPINAMVEFRGEVKVAHTLPELRAIADEIEAKL